MVNDIMVHNGYIIMVNNGSSVSSCVLTNKKGTPIRIRTENSAGKSVVEAQTTMASNRPNWPKWTRKRRQGRFREV